MNAKEAREKASVIHAEKNEKQKNRIFELIKLATNKGEYLINFNQPIENDVRVQLIELGYNVGEQKMDGPMEYRTVISW